MTGVFRTKSFYFLFDESIKRFAHPAAVDVDDERFDLRFPKAALPELGRAPIGSWFVARLAFLTGGGLGRLEGDVQSVDGGSCCLEPSIFTGERRHVGSLQLQADTEIAVFGTFDASIQGGLAIDEFVECLLSDPKAVREIAIKVRDPEGNTTRTYGFDGVRFRGGKTRR
jgi:hypothetical protein